MEIDRYYSGSGAVRLQTSFCCAALVAALVAGCAGAAEPKAAQVNLSGFSPSFKQGYADGCESASTRSHLRHESRYKTEADYMMGWNDGFNICAKRK